MDDRVKEKYLKVKPWDLGIDIEEFLIGKGYEFTSRGDWLALRCPFPEHDDSNPSFFIHIHHLGWNCYVCGSGTWKDFLEKMGWEQEEISDISINQLPLQLWKDFTKSINSSVKSQKQFSIPKGLNIVSNTGASVKHYKYLEKRNIVNLIDIFNICYTKKYDNIKRGDGKLLYGSVYKNRVIIPCHNEIGKVIWYEGRYIGKNKIENKYWRPPGINKTKFLFNFHRVKRKGYKWTILVEGIIDAMILWSRKIPAVCCYGARVSEEQLGLLMEFDKVYVCLDNDDAGIEGWIKLKRQISETGIEVLRIIMPRKKDVNDITHKEFIRRYERAK